jgi:hypothetical protein
MSNINNGLMTKIWGPHMWFAVHSIAYGYPINPTPDQKEQYKIFLQYLGFVLPCSYCRQSYLFFITDGDTKLTDEVFENRESLTKWTFRIHNRVNNKLSYDYGTTYEEVSNKFESFRAKCVLDVPNCQMPLELKSVSFKEADKKQSFIIPLKLAQAFQNYALKRSVNLDNLEYYNDLVHNKRNTEEYEKRNIDCNNIITNMRYNAIHSIEQEGEYKGLPSIEELSLIKMLCSSLPIRNLQDIAKEHLGYQINKKYKFIKSN